MSDYLILVCELASAFAGFTAIVSALDGRASRRSRFDKMRLRQMLELSLFTIGIGLLPEMLGKLGMDGTTPWRVAGVVAVASALVLFPIQMRRGFDPEMKAVPGYNLAYARFLVGLALFSVVAFLLASTALVAPQGGYILGTTLVLTAAGLQFFRVCISILATDAESTIG